MKVIAVATPFIRRVLHTSRALYHAWVGYRVESKNTIARIMERVPRDSPGLGPASN
jgi:hypothetical protein